MRDACRMACGATRLAVVTATLASATLVSACASHHSGATTTASAGSVDLELAHGLTGGAKIEIELDSPRHLAGDTVQMRIINHEDAAFGFNACTRTIEWRKTGEWFAVPDTARVCTMNLQTLRARDSVNVTTTLPGILLPGDYRIVISFSREEGPAPAGRVATTPSATARIATREFMVQ